MENNENELFLAYADNISDRKPFPDCISKLVIGILKKEGVTNLFPPQADTIEAALNLEDNLLINLPTSCGKTLIAELIMIESILKTRKKALYLAPFKALAKEKSLGFKSRWSELGLNIVQLTGGETVSEEKLLAADIIILTNEKADIIFRNKKRESLFESIGLIVCDEIHLLGEGNRGMTLEVLLTRFLYSMYKKLLKCRIIGLSATVGNPRYLSNWIGAKLIRSEWRPVKLQEFIYCNGKSFGAKYDIKKHRIHKQLVSNRKVDLLKLSRYIIRQNSQALVFMNTRSETETMKINMEKDGLRGLVEFHHAGLEDKEKTAREDKFKRGEIKILLSTTTLSAGINLPASFVIIYNPTMPGLSNQSFISVISYNQMAGRAGRIGMSDKGVCFILAENTKEIEKFHTRYLNGKPEDIISEFDLDKNTISEEHIKSATYSIVQNPIINLQKHLLGFFILPEINSLENVIDFMQSSFYYSYQKTPAVRRTFELYINTCIDTLEKKFGMVVRKEDNTLTLSLLGFITVRLYIYPVTVNWIKHRFKFFYEYCISHPEYQVSKSNATIVFLLYSLINLPDSTTRIGSTADLEFCYAIKRTLESTGFLSNVDKLVLENNGLMSSDSSIRAKCIGNIKAIAVLLDRMNGKETQEILNDYEYGMTDYTELWMKFSELSRKLETIISFSGFYTNRHIKGLKELLRYISLKVLYSVDDRLLDLCQIDEIGKATAEKLYTIGIRNAIDVVKAPDQNMMKIRGIGEKKMIRIKLAALKHIGNTAYKFNHEDALTSEDFELLLKKYRKLNSQFTMSERKITDSIELTD